MAVVFRSMQADGNYPKVDPRGLGVRVPPDRHPDIRPDDQGMVDPSCGGMSVSPSIDDIPLFLFPQRLRAIRPGAAGKDSLKIWTTGTGAFADGSFAPGLTLRCDGPAHGLVEPATRVRLAEYQAALAATSPDWRIAEPNAD